MKMKILSKHGGIQESDKRFCVPSMLKDVAVDGKSQEYYLGRESFGVVRLQLFCGIKVAVKEMLPHTLAADVIH